MRSVKEANDLININTPKYRTAVHEAGHAVLVMELGGHPSVWLWAEQRGEHRVWAGTCYIGDTSGFPGNWKALVGMAGSLAELLSSRQSCTVEAACTWLHVSTHSKADQEMMTDYTVDDVQQCMTILRDQWPTMEAIARQLLISPVDHDPRPAKVTGPRCVPTTMSG